MAGPLIAVVGDANPNRQFTPAMNDPAKARQAAEALGAELARRGARLLAYGGPFIEADVVRGYVSANPKEDKSILMWYTKNQSPPPFPEETTHPKLFDRRIEGGSDWEVAFYRSLTRADGLILIGGANATQISGQVAVGSRMAIVTLPEFGGAAAKVWDTLSPGEDLPSREDKDVMGQPWNAQQSPKRLIDSLYGQLTRRRLVQGAPSPALSIFAGLLFLAAIAIVAFTWGKNDSRIWMLFLAPLLAGGAGSAIRPVYDRVRGTPAVAQAVVTTIVLGVIAGGVAGLLFVTAQLSGNSKVSDLGEYARNSMPYAVTVGFIAGLTSDAVFSKLLGLDVVRTTGVTATK